MNKLYFGDNLEILREMDAGRVDLICTDPPFNRGRDYNSFIGDSLAQKKAFTDPPFNSGRDYNSFIGDSLAQKKAFTDTGNARMDVGYGRNYPRLHSGTRP